MNIPRCLCVLVLLANGLGNYAAGGLTLFPKPVVPGEWIAVVDESLLGLERPARVTEIRNGRVLAEVDYNADPQDVTCWRTRRLSARKQRKLARDGEETFAMAKTVLAELRAAGGDGELFAVNKRFVRVRKAPALGLSGYDEPATYIFDDTAALDKLIAEVEAREGVVLLYRSHPSLTFWGRVHVLAGGGPVRRARSPGHPIFTFALVDFASHHTVAHEKIHVDDFLTEPFVGTRPLEDYVPHPQNWRERWRNKGVLDHTFGLNELRAIDGSNAPHRRTFAEYPLSDRMYYLRNDARRTVGAFILDPGPSAFGRAVVANVKSFKAEKILLTKYHARRAWRAYRYHQNKISCATMLGSAGIWAYLYWFR